MWVTAWLYSVFIGQWLWALFRHGPATLGGWKGMAEPDMCARLARNSEARDWALPNTDGTPSGPCLNMIQREYEAFAVVVHTALYCAAVVGMLTWARHWWVTRSQARAFARAIADAWPVQAPPRCLCGPSCQAHGEGTATVWRQPAVPS